MNMQALLPGAVSGVRVRELGVRYGDQDVLAGLDLDVQAGEFLVLLGPSGCGKSTLLHSIAGLLDTSAGSIEIGGQDMTFADPSARGIGMVFQSYALYPNMTVLGNLSFGLRVAGVPRAEIERRVQHTAQMLQLGPLLARKPSQLSGGQRQRVAIGRALVRQAGVYLLDEPLSNLDAQLRTELRRELKLLHRALGATMIYVTHDQVEAMTLATRIAIMRQGVIQQIGTPQEVYERPANRFVAGFVGSPAMNFVEGALAATSAESTSVRQRCNCTSRARTLPPARPCWACGPSRSASTRKGASTARCSSSNPWAASRSSGCSVAARRWPPWSTMWQAWRWTRSCAFKSTPRACRSLTRPAAHGSRRGVCSWQSHPQGAWSWSAVAPPAG
jgi:multiple sugar transport system ATP-binding protein